MLLVGVVVQHVLDGRERLRRGKRPRRPIPATAVLRLVHEPLASPLYRRWAKVGEEALLILKVVKGRGVRGVVGHVEHPGDVAHDLAVSQESAGWVVITSLVHEK